MSDLTDTDRAVLLRLARSAIESHLVPERPIEKPESLSPVLKEKRGCFVTLHKRGCLRGCIGIIEPERSLVAHVEEYARNAAFHDPRFPPLSREELSEIDIEISVLTPPQPLTFSDSDDLKARLRPGIHGVILSCGWQRATFLPQVWKQLPDTEAFLEHLCMKAGMERDGWKNPRTVVEVYEAEYFGENPKG